MVHHTLPLPVQRGFKVAIIIEVDKSSGFLVVLALWFLLGLHVGL